MMDGIAKSIFYGVYTARLDQVYTAVLARKKA